MKVRDKATCIIYTVIGEYSQWYWLDGSTVSKPFTDRKHNFEEVVEYLVEWRDKRLGETVFGRVQTDLKNITCKPNEIVTITYNRG